MNHPGDMGDEDMHSQARQWLIRLTSGEATTLDAEQFRLWCQQSPEHRQAFTEAKRLWGSLETAIQAEQQDQAPFDQQSIAPARHRVWGRRAFLGAMAASLGVMAVRSSLDMSLIPDLMPSADLQTATGEQREVQLSTAVTLNMNTQTRINLPTSHDHLKVVELISGEAQIQSEKQQGQLLLVQSQGGDIQAGRAHFNVRSLAGKVCVTCLAGRLAVSYQGEDIPLLAGQQVTYGRQTIGHVVDAERARVLAWPQQMLVFDNEPLHLVVAEINRYRPGRLVLMNDRLGERLVQARFSLAQLNEIPLLIRDAYGATLTRLPGGVVLLS